MTQLSGIKSFDDFLAGGLSLGDNVVWIAAGGADVTPFVSAFLSKSTGANGIRRHIDLSSHASSPAPLHETNVEVVAPAGGLDRLGPNDLEDLLLQSDISAGSRLAITGLDEMLVRWGSAATVRFYTRTCPRLFDRGAIAYWVGTRDVLGSACIEGVTRIAQCVFELRPDRLRIVKAEGHPARLQGAIVEVKNDDGVPVISRPHAGGRVAEGLRRVRRERNLTQTQIATMAGVTPAAISQAESGRRGLSLDTVVPLCETLGLSVDEFLGTSRHSDPYIARHDRNSSTDRSIALFDDLSLGPVAHLVRLVRDESGRPPFVHKGPELILVASGLILLDLGDTTPVLRAGDALMATRTPIRRWTNLDQHDASLFWVAVSPSLM